MTDNAQPEIDTVKKMVDFDALPASWRALGRDFEESALVEVIYAGFTDPGRARVELERRARAAKLWSFDG